MTQKKNSIGGVMLLMLTAFIWGSAFVAQSKGMDRLGAFAFGSIRTLLGSFALFVYILIYQRIKKAHSTSESLTKYRSRVKQSVLKGIPIGLVYFFATNFQQYAFYYSTAGKIAFITAMYILFVPVLGLFAGRRLGALKWIAVFLGITGLWLLCIGANGLGSVNRGDLLALACSVCFTFHILLIDRCSDVTDGAALSCTQFLVAGSMTFVLMLVFEGMPKMSDVILSAVPIAYAGIMSCAV
ncbi:MAG: DMT family transporter, partial [Lachnospiraceae bacterium]|nr:DMT family transporter [Lachnospiraceae bacterium]